VYASALESFWQPNIAPESREAEALDGGLDEHEIAVAERTEKAVRRAQKRMETPFALCSCTSDWATGFTGYIES
jgi:hypothetical protein